MICFVSIAHCNPIPRGKTRNFSSLEHQYFLFLIINTPNFCSQKINYWSQHMKMMVFVWHWQKVQVKTSNLIFWNSPLKKEKELFLGHIFIFTGVFGELLVDYMVLSGITDEKSQCKILKQIYTWSLFHLFKMCSLKHVTCPIHGYRNG